MRLCVESVQVNTEKGEAVNTAELITIEGQECRDQPAEFEFIAPLGQRLLAVKPLQIGSADDATILDVRVFASERMALEPWTENLLGRRFEVRWRGTASAARVRAAEMLGDSAGDAPIR